MTHHNPILEPCDTESCQTSLLCLATTFPVMPLCVAAVLDDSYPAPKQR